MSAAIDRGIRLVIEGLRARMENREFAAGVREFWELALGIGPDLFVTSVRDTFAEQIAVALARDSGGDVDALREEARSAIGRDMLSIFAMRAGGRVQ